MIKTTSPTRIDKRYSKYYTYIEPIIFDPVIAGYFTLVATLVLTAFFIIFALSPTFSTIVGLMRKIDDQKKLISQMDSKINSLIIAQENYSQMEEYLPLIENAIPKKPLPETLITDTLSTSSSSGVVIKSFRIGRVDLFGTKLLSSGPESSQPTSVNNKAINALEIPIVDFKISISGNESSVRQFAEKLQNLPRIISLTTISIGADSTGGQTDPDGLSADIAGVAYYEF